MTDCAFDSKDLRLFTSVLDQICLDPGVEDFAHKSMIGARIISLAQTGERDREKLRKYATWDICFNHPREPAGRPFLELFGVSRIEPAGECGAA